MPRRIASTTVLTPDDRRKARQYEELLNTATPGELAFRHSHWKARREKTREILASIGTSSKAMFAFENCGADCIVEFSELEQRYRKRASYCHSRHCQPCMRSKAARIRMNLSKVIRDNRPNRYRFFTFTLKHDDTPLRDQIQRLYRCFTKLRRDRLWKDTQVGGAFMLEVHHTGKHWHPHLHVIGEGDFIPRQQLINLWHRVTENSFIVDVRAINNTDGASRYVTKYITKPADENIINDRDKAQEYFNAIRGVRTCSTYGKWRGVKLSERQTDADDWKAICKLDTLVKRAEDGDKHSQIILSILAGNARDNSPKAKSDDTS